MVDELLLLSGNDIPFPIAQLTIHPPRIKEIAYITEKRFWSGCELLKFEKDFLTEQDKNNLSHLTNFNIIMSMIQGKNIESQQMKINTLSLLTLMFPTKQILIKTNKIELIDRQENNQISQINDQNFERFKEIFIKMFCLKNSEIQEYNPAGQAAKKIADKFKRAREKRAKLEPDNTAHKVAILSRYVSILAVGLNKSINDLMNYTVYQLMDQFTRFTLKLHFDSWTQYRIAGADGMTTPDDWLKDIYKKDDTKQDDSNSDQLVFL